jgi:hypothetical protein
MIVRLLVVLCSIAFFLCIPGHSVAAVFGSLYNHSTSRNDLYSIDAKQGVATFLNSIDFEAGEAIWQLTIENARAYTQSSRNNLYEIDTLTGGMLSVKSIPMMQTMTSRGNGSLFGVTYNPSTNQNEVFSIDVATGATTFLNSFVFDSGSWNADLVRSNNRVFAQSSIGTLYEFDLGNGSIVSTKPGLVGFQSMVSNNQGSLVGILYNVTTSKNEFHSIDPISGTTSLLNSFNFDSFGWRGKLVLEGDSVYAISSIGSLYRFDFTTGVIRSVTPGLPEFGIMASSFELQQPVPEPSSIVVFLQGATLIWFRKKARKLSAIPRAEGT